MSTGVSKTSTIASIRQRFAYRSGMDGQGATLMRKLLDGRRLTALEREIAAATGLGAAVADLVGASQGAQSAQGLLAGAKGNANVVLKSRNVMNKIAEADAVFADHYAGYGKVSRGVRESKLGQAAVRTAPTQEKIFGLATDVMTVAGLGLSAVALPEMAKKTATSFHELKTMIHDPNATIDQRLDKSEEMVRAASGTIFSAQGVYMGAKGTVQILSRSRTIGSAFAKLGDSKFLGFMKYSPIGKALGALLPVADGAVFIGEVIATRRTFKDPTATGSQRARKALDLSLASLKVAFWLFPGVQALRTAYKFASLGQMGLMLKDFHETLKPQLAAAGRKLVWGLTHPVEGLKATGNWISRTAGAAVKGVAHGLGWLVGKLADPVGTWRGMVSEVRAWRGAVDGPQNQTPATPAAPQGQVPLAPQPAPAQPVEGLVAAPQPAPAPVAVPAPAPVAAPAPAPQPALELPLPEAAPAVSTDAAYAAAMAEIAGTPPAAPVLP
ncbi:MAG: hypothetical protein ACLGIN_08460 [Candidatus Sericytochromatia bacterium]